MLVNLLVAFTEPMPEILKGRRRHRGITEVRMAIDIRR
jgi:hypothetical protein